MTTVAPSYAAADLPAPPPYSKDEDVKIQTAAANEFASNPDVANALQIDIGTLTKTLKDLDDDFRTVSVKLGEIDKKQLTSTKYQGPWDKYYSRYQTVLNKSRTSANEIADNANDFDTHYLPYVCGKKKPEDSKEKRLKDLQFYIQDLKASEKTSKEVQKEFTDLADEITTFKNSFVNFAEDEIKKTTGEIATLRTDIAGLKTKISELTKKFAILLGAIAVVGIVGIALAICFPVFAGAIGTATLLAIGGIATKAYETLQEKNAAQESLTKKEAELKEKTAKLDELQKAHDDLIKIGETEVTRVVAGVGMLGDIWSRVYDDCKKVETYLTKTEKAWSEYENDPDAPAVIISYLKSGHSVYKGLGSALKAYSTGIQQAKTS